MLAGTIILYGGGSPLIVDYEEICQRQQIKIAAIVNNLPQAQCYACSGARQIVPKQISHLNSDLFTCPLFTPKNRYQATEEALEMGLTPFPLLNARTNLLPSNFVHGNGVFLNKGVIIGAVADLGNHVIVNRGATLGHDLKLGDYVSIGPGVVTGGNVTVGRGSMIGAGSTILPTIKIGQHAIVGAGSVVTKDVKDFAVVVGNPARKIRESKLKF